MAGFSRRLIACLQTGKLAFLAILVASGIVLQVLACTVYNNWWPMLTAVMYVILPMPLLFFVGSDSSSLMSSDSDSFIFLLTDSDASTNSDAGVAPLVGSSPMPHLKFIVYNKKYCHHLANF
ncbi:hypothetical protein M5K25_010162 [Dendrobium thyrsiflorum]|uniref:Uncharacterized protein n=1 Tax=Dendrobium thyrsiflorum TaxID=117978 RepID=A0ABD0UYY9_DENTH